MRLSPILVLDSPIYDCCKLHLPYRFSAAFQGSFGFFIWATSDLYFPQVQTHRGRARLWLRRRKMMVRFVKASVTNYAAHFIIAVRLWYAIVLGVQKTSRFRHFLAKQCYFSDTSLASRNHLSPGRCCIVDPSVNIFLLLFKSETFPFSSRAAWTETFLVQRKWHEFERAGMALHMKFEVLSQMI